MKYIYNPKSMGAHLFRGGYLEVSAGKYITVEDSLVESGIFNDAIAAKSVELYHNVADIPVRNAAPAVLDTSVSVTNPVDQVDHKSLDELTMFHVAKELKAKEKFEAMNKGSENQPGAAEFKGEGLLVPPTPSDITKAKSQVFTLTPPVPASVKTEEASEVPAAPAVKTGRKSKVVAEAPTETESETPTETKSESES